MFNQTITAYTHSIPTSWGKSWQAEEVPVSAVLTLSHGKSSIVYKKVVSKSIAVSKLKDFMNNTTMFGVDKLVVPLVHVEGLLVQGVSVYAN